MCASFGTRQRCPMPKVYLASVTYRLTERNGEYLPIRARRVRYSGEWAYCKGDNTAKQAEQQQMQFDQQLMGIFSQQYATQKGILSYLQGKMQPIINAGGTGFDNATLTAMRTSASDTNALEFKNAEQALQNRETQMSGGSKLLGVSGAASQNLAALMQAGAEQEANTQNDITKQNALLKNANYWNAINVLNGTAAEANPLGYSASATYGSNSVANLSEAVTYSGKSQLLGALGGIAGGMATGLAKQSATPSNSNQGTTPTTMAVFP